MLASINEEIKYRHYEPNPKIISPSKELVEIGLMLERFKNDYTNLPKEKIKTILKSSREFLNSKYNLHNIPFEYYKKNFFLQLQISGMTDPFSLPIKRVKIEDDFYGAIREVITFKDEGTTIAFRYIELPKSPTKLTSLSYTHEITHSQLNHMKGIIKEYYNTEVFSIFNELLHAYFTPANESLLRIHDARRLGELSICISELAKYKDSQDEEIKSVLLEGSCYCASTLKAYQMFLRFYYGSLKEQKRLINGVQRVMDGKITLEDELEKLDISFEGSQDIKTLKKYLNR